MALSPTKYSAVVLNAASGRFCNGLLVSSKGALLEDLLSPDCRFSTNKEKEDIHGISLCLQRLEKIREEFVAFENEKCTLRRGLKVNEDQQKSRLLLLPVQVTYSFRAGFILQWECGLLVHITFIEDPWQGFLDELTPSEENRKLNSKGTRSLKKSVSADHYSWRRISNIVVDALLVSLEEGSVVRISQCESSMEIIEDSSSKNNSNDNKNDNRKHQQCNKENEDMICCKSIELKLKDETFDEDRDLDVAKELILEGSDNGEDDDSSEVLRELSWDNVSPNDSGVVEEQNTSTDVNVTKKVRFDTTVSAVLICERCEILGFDLFYDRNDLQLFQSELNSDIMKIQKEQSVSPEVAMQIYFCDKPEEINKMKSSSASKPFAPKSPSSGEDKWYPGKYLPIVRLVKAFNKKRNVKKIEERRASRDSSLSRASSIGLEGAVDISDVVEDRITEIRASSFGSSLRGRDPEATKLVVTVKVLSCVNLSTRNPTFNKLRTMNTSVKVQIGSEFFETPVVPSSNPVFDGEIFLFSVPLDEVACGSIICTIHCTALKKNVVGAVRIPLAALETRHDSSSPSRIILPITKNKPNFSSIGKGFYLCPKQAETEEADKSEIDSSEDAAFLKHMYKINRLSKESLNYDIEKMPKLYLEINKVDVSNQFT